MFRETKVISISSVKTSDQANVIARNILKSQDVVDQHIFVVDSQDKYLTSTLMLLNLQHPHFFKIEKVKSIEYYLSKFANQPNTYYIFLDGNTLYISPQTIPNLLSELAKGEFKVVHPMVIGTARAMYIHQTVGELPPVLLRRWDVDYMNDISLSVADPRLTEAIHLRFLQSLSQNNLLKFSFGPYMLNAIEPSVWQFAAWKSGSKKLNKKTLSEMFKCGQNEACILTNSYAANLGVEEHQPYISQTNIPNLYKNIVDIDTSPEESTHNDMFDFGFSTSLLMSDKDNKYDPKFAVSSHADSYKKTIPRLVTSLLLNKVSKKNIVIVVGGMESNRLETIDGILYSFVTHNSYDHTALIDILEKGWSCKWWILFHDTCSVGVNFMNFIRKKGPKAEHISFLNEGWLNMGVFSLDALKRIRPYIMAQKNGQKMQAILTEKMYPRLIKHDTFEEVLNVEFGEAQNIYNDDVMRAPMYMPRLDMMKYQQYHYNSNPTAKLITSWLIKPNQIVEDCLSYSKVEYVC